MTIKQAQFAVRSFVLASLWLLAGFDGFGATTNLWTNSVGSLWRINTNWSAAIPPGASFDFTVISNTGTKTVTIDSPTAATNLSLRGLVVSAPAGFTNTLELVSLSSPLNTSRPVAINSGGVLRVFDSTLALQNTFDVNAGTLTVDSGLVDTSTNFIDVRVGRVSGATGTVNLNGGTLQCNGFRLGEFANAQGVCTLNGGTLLASSVVSVGEVLNSSATLTILSGQLIATNDITKIGNVGTGLMNQSGGLSHFAFFSIGDNLPGTVNISGGQCIVTPASPLDLTRVGNFGTAQMNISGGLVWSRCQFDVADNAGVSGTVLMTGGQLIATNDLVAIGRYGLGEMTVTNATATFTNTSVGRHTGANGSLTVQDGGSVYCLDALSIGRFTNSNGQVLVPGGLLSLTNDSIWVGREGIGTLTVFGGTVRARGLFVGMSEDGTNTPQGTVTISGGAVLLSSNVVVGTSLLSTGQVNVVGGLCSITNQTGSGLLNVVSGSFDLNLGTVAVDQLMLTNTNGLFNFSGGALIARGMTVSNGAPFVVGDGVNAATLQLEGGTYAFADGLVISSNATVTGCGTILGSISNHGTLSTNCGPVVTITALSTAGTTATVWYSTISGATHVLEFKNALSDPTWSALLPGVLGDGGVMNQQDTAATNRTRFYRIQVQ